MAVHLEKLMSIGLEDKKGSLSDPGRFARAIRDLAYSFKTRFEGDPTVIGQKISVEHEQLTIVAVMPREFDCPATADLWWPRNPGEAPQAAGGPDARFLNVVGRLKPGVSLDTAQHQLSDLVGRIKPAVGGSSPGPQWGVSVVSVERNLTSREFAPLVALLGLAIVLIAIASLGAARRLLDSEAEALGAADIQTFETEGLIGSSAAPAVLAYLFHRIESQLDGSPSLIIIDEGWLALDDKGFAGQLREWLKTLRKKNASVVFATQSLADIETSPIAPAIVESCPTRLFLPNERAFEPQIAAIYRRFGLNDRQIEIIARATPKRDYYCQSRRGNRLFELGLGPLALALCAASSKTDQKLISGLLAEYGRDGFARAWLVSRGLVWAADLLSQQNELEAAS